MIQEEWAYRIRQALTYAPTVEQSKAIDVFCQFAADTNDRSVMLLRGSAGTGKTTLASAIVKAMAALQQKVMLLAPTGRAAKVFAINSGHNAYTIHRKIYRQKTFSGEMTGFNLNDNLLRDTLFIIDEASMVSNTNQTESFFGSGFLLDDLVHFVYSGSNCRMMLIGDKAQLPPVGEEESPALQDTFLAGYGLNVYSCDLNEVLRQSQESGILYNATVIRRMITHDSVTQLPRIRFNGFPDIHVVPGGELIESLNTSYGKVGYDETIVITRSNKRANIYNNGIRASVLDREEQLCRGDILMVVRNNYYWTLKEKTPLEFIANGDRVKVLRVKNHREFYGLHFADISMAFPDYDNLEIQATVILDSLTSDAPSLTREQSDALFQGVFDDYFDVPLKQDRMQRVREDMHYNALQIKYAYAVTCHKAQGGQWQHVYVDQGYMTDDMLTPDYIHWLYTAFTRATDKLFLVNWPDSQTE